MKKGMKTEKLSNISTYILFFPTFHICNFLYFSIYLFICSFIHVYLFIYLHIRPPTQKKHCNSGSEEHIFFSLQRETPAPHSPAAPEDQVLVREKRQDEPATNPGTGPRSQSVFPFSFPYLFIFLWVGNVVKGGIVIYIYL